MPKVSALSSSLPVPDLRWGPGISLLGSPERLAPLQGGQPGLCKDINSGAGGFHASVATSVWASQSTMWLGMDVV